MELKTHPRQDAAPTVQPTAVQLPRLPHPATATVKTLAPATIKQEDPPPKIIKQEEQSPPATPPPATTAVRLQATPQNVTMVRPIKERPEPPFCELVYVKGAPTIRQVTGPHTCYYSGGRLLTAEEQTIYRNPPDWNGAGANYNHGQSNQMLCDLRDNQ